MPKKFAFGVKITFVPLMLATPFVGVTLRIVKLPPGVRTTSFTNGLNVFVVFSVMLPLSGFASGGKFVTSVTTGGVRLLVGTGSPVGLPTVAVFVRLPRAVEITLTVRFVLPPEIKLPRSGQMTWLLAFVVVDGMELTNTKPAGKLSVTDKLAAVDGPRFVTLMV